MELTAENVNETFMKCLFKDDEIKDLKEGEIPEGAVLTKGVMAHVGFHPERLEQEKNNISAMLMQLPKQFREKEGGGWSFLNACNNKDGDQWTDFHKTMDELVCLGIGSGYVEFQLPREMWKMLPGGVPYFMIKEH